MTSLHQLLPGILASPPLHAKWLNTLSYLENCGARMIAACEHPTQVEEEVLKHAAEEFRHAHYLKQQIERVCPTPLPNYSLPYLLGGTASLHYLRALDLHTSRYLTTHKLPTTLAYLLVTYAIELRAEELYPLYDALLRQAGSRVTVKSILLEEKEHLNEMREGLSQIPSGFTHAAHICSLEATLYAKWLSSLFFEVIQRNSDQCSAQTPSLRGLFCGRKERREARCTG
jgi:hypothetical protein